MDNKDHRSQIAKLLGVPDPVEEERKMDTEFMDMLRKEGAAQVKQPLFSPEHEADLAAQHLFLKSHEGSIAFKSLFGMLRVVTKDGLTHAQRIDYLEPDAAKQLRDKLNEWFPLSEDA